MVMLTLLRSNAWPPPPPPPPPPQFAMQIAFGTPVSPGMHLFETHLYFCTEGAPQSGSMQLVHLQYVTLLQTE